MKRTFTLLLAVLLTTTFYSQKIIQELTFDDCQNSEVFQKIRNNTQILKYTAADGSIFSIGDTLIIGTPSGNISNTKRVGAGNSIRAGREQTRTKSNFQSIIMGRPAGFGNIMAAMSGDQPINAGSDMQGELVIVSEMKVAHKGSKKKPLQLIILLGEPNGRAFGVNKYMSVVDYEKAVLNGEIRSIHAPLSRAEAVAKLKESKELLDLGIITSEEYEKLKTELTPIILKKESIY